MRTALKAALGVMLAAGLLWGEALAKRASKGWATSYSGDVILLGQIATASLPATTDATDGTSTKGGITYDTTRGCPVYSAGVAASDWKCIAAYSSDAAQFDNGLTSSATVHLNGDVYVTDIIRKDANSLPLSGQVADGAGNKGVKIGNETTLTNATAKIVSFCADSSLTCATERAYIYAADGTFHTGTTGTQTFGSWNAQGLGAIATGANFVGPFQSSKTVTFGKITCSWGTAGTGGTVGVRVRVQNITDASTLCTCTLGACTTTAGTPLSCSCNTIDLASKNYTLQLDPTGGTGTDCTLDPANTACNVELLQ